MVGHPCMQRVQLGFTCPAAPPSSDNHPDPLGFHPLSAGPRAASTSHTTSTPNTIDRAYAGECALPPRRKRTQEPTCHEEPLIHPASVPVLRVTPSPAPPSRVAPRVVSRQRGGRPFTLCGAASDLRLYDPLSWMRGHSTSTDGGRRGTLTDGELRVLPLHLPLGFSGGDGTRASTAAVCGSGGGQRVGGSAGGPAGEGARGAGGC